MNQLKPIPINDKEIEEFNGQDCCFTAFNRFNRVLPFVLALIGGIIVGLSARTMKESYIYSAILFFESFMCYLLRFYFQNPRQNQILRSFTVYFAIASIMSPSSTWFGFYLS